LNGIGETDADLAHGRVQRTELPVTERLVVVPVAGEVCRDPIHAVVVRAAVQTVALDVGNVIGGVVAKEGACGRQRAWDFRRAGGEARHGNKQRQDQCAADSYFHNHILLCVNSNRKLRSGNSGPKIRYPRPSDRPRIFTTARPTLRTEQRIAGLS